MGRVHEIGIAADGREFDRGIRNDVIKPLEKAEDALDDFGDAATDASREAGRGLDNLEDDLKRAQRQTERLTDEQKKVGDVGDRSFRRVGGIGGEVSDELRQNLGETFSSFKGDLEDLPQIAQDTLGGLAGSGALGGIAGLAVTAAGAAGLGLISAEMQNQIEKAEALRERLAGVYQEAAEEGRNYIDTAQIIAEANDLMFNPDRADEWKQLQADAKELGLENYDVIAANAGQSEAQAEVQERINALIETTKEKTSDSEGLTAGLGVTVQGIKNRWQEVIGVTEEQKAKVAELESVTATTEERNREQIKRTSDAAKNRYAGLRDSLKSIDVPVRYTVDDEAVRNYVPPRKVANVVYTAGKYGREVR